MDCCVAFRREFVNDVKTRLWKQGAFGRIAPSNFLYKVVC